MPSRRTWGTTSASARTFPGRPHGASSTVCPAARPEHRARGGRSSRCRTAGHHLALRWLGKEVRSRLHLWPPSGPDEPLRQRARRARCRQGGSRLCPGRTNSRTVHRGARHAEEPAASSVRCSRRSVRSRFAQRLTIGNAAGARHDRRRSTAEGRGVCAPLLPFLEHVLLVGEDGQPTRRRRHARLPALDGRQPTIDSRSRRPIRKIWRCCTSPAARPARPRERCTSTRRSSRTTSPASSPSTCIPTTSSGARPIPGWVTGTSYGIIAPLTNGVTSIIDEGDFDAERWYGILQDQRVTVWYTAPTAIRMMMKVGRRRASANTTCGHLRFLASVGEPLNPEAVVWGREAFGLPFHDNWWQTETGGIMIANYRRDGHSPRLDGPAAARHRGRRSSRSDRRRRRRGHRGAGRAGRTGSAAGLAVDVSRLLERAGALSEVLCRRLVSDRRPRAPRSRRLLLVRRPQGRRDQDLRPPDRPVRSRKRADGAPGRGRGGRDRQARSRGVEIVKAFVVAQAGFEPER